MVGSSVLTSTILEKGHLDQTLSCNIPLQIGILFDAEVCSSLAIIYIVLHMTPRVVFDREQFAMLFVVPFRLTTYL